VRYEPNSHFPTHDHPEGEEILVLEGVFSDEYGDWSAGTYLLNPEGFRHTPFSKPGCRLFVKLRQFPDGKAPRCRRYARGRVGTELDTGVCYKALYQQAGFSDAMRLERWEPDADPGILSYEQGAELFVLDGEFVDERGPILEGLAPASSWLDASSTITQRLHAVHKESGLPYLRWAGA
jgi:hypothetical protein